MKQGRKKMVLEDEGTVLDKARERMDHVWEEYDQLWVSFSGGKDSGTVLSMTMDAWERNGPFTDENGDETIVNVIHFDDEFHYPETLDYIERCLDRYGDRLKFWWCAIPIKYGIASTILPEYDSKYWYPWDPDEEGNWYRTHPKNDERFTKFDCVEVVTQDHELIDHYGGDWKHKHVATRMIAQKAVENTMQLVGVRTAESLNRHTAVLRANGWTRSRKARWGQTKFGDKLFKDGRDFMSAFPVYDWSDRDLWKIHEQEGWDYNKAYDKFHQLGWAPGDMRTGLPWGYMAIQAGDPQDQKHHWAEEYDRWINRHTGMDTVFSWGRETVGPFKPDDMTYEEYTAMLLNNVEDEDTKERLVNLIEGRCERHYEHAREPLADDTPCQLCGESWRFAATDVYEEVFGIRTGQS